MPQLDGKYCGTLEPVALTDEHGRSYGAFAFRLCPGEPVPYGFPFRAMLLVDEQGRVMDLSYWPPHQPLRVTGRSRIVQVWNGSGTAALDSYPLRKPPGERQVFVVAGLPQRANDGEACSCRSE